MRRRAGCGECRRQAERSSPTRSLGTVPFSSFGQPRGDMSVTTQGSFNQERRYSATCRSRRAEVPSFSGPVGCCAGDRRLRFALWKDETRRLIRKRGRKRGRSQFRRSGQNEFKNAFTTPDTIRKHMRVLTTNPQSLKWRMPRGGLEPPTSAVIGPERCAYDLRKLDCDERCSRCYVVSARQRDVGPVAD